MGDYLILCYFCSLKCNSRWLDGNLGEHLGKYMEFLAHVIPIMARQFVWPTNTNFPSTLKGPFDVVTWLVLFNCHETQNFRLCFEVEGMVVHVHGEKS